MWLTLEALQSMLLMQHEYGTTSDHGEDGRGNDTTSRSVTEGEQNLVRMRRGNPTTSTNAMTTGAARTPRHDSSPDGENAGGDNHQNVNDT